MGFTFGKVCHCTPKRVWIGIAFYGKHCPPSAQIAPDYSRRRCIQSVHYALSRVEIEECRIGVAPVGENEGPEIQDVGKQEIV